MPPPGEIEITVPGNAFLARDAPSKVHVGTEQVDAEPLSGGVFLVPRSPAEEEAPLVTYEVEDTPDADDKAQVSTVSKLASK